MECGGVSRTCLPGDDSFPLTQPGLSRPLGELGRPTSPFCFLAVIALIRKTHPLLRCVCDALLSQIRLYKH